MAEVPGICTSASGISLVCRGQGAFTRASAGVEAFEVTKEVWSEFLVDLEEDVFQVAHRNAVRPDLKLLQALI